MRAGTDGLAEAMRALASAETGREGLAPAEQTAREALESFRSALNWAEDGPREAEAHDRLDSAGKWVRQTFGCTLPQEGTSYFLTCPVRLGHVRVGLSIGGTATRTCSLCGEDLSECEHQRGVAYQVPGGVGELGWCRVCAKTECQEHSPDQFYRAGVIAIIGEMALDEVSIVAKPGHPDARIHRQSVDTADLRATLGEQWRPGMPVSCDFCLSPCRGLIRPHLGPAANSSDRPMM